MRFTFTELPGDRADHLRPVIPVVVEGLPRAPLACLVDSGSPHNRFGISVALRAGIDLTDAERTESALAGLTTTAHTVPVALTIGDASWEAPVGFCDPWPFGFQILGQEGFMRWFRIGIRAAIYSLELTPEED